MQRSGAFLQVSLILFLRGFATLDEKLPAPLQAYSYAGSRLEITHLTFRRSPFFALAYAANDVVLIILWVLASVVDARYISVVVCFAAFLVNDLYGFFSWQRMKRRQLRDDTAADLRSSI